MKIVIAAWHLKDFNVGLGRYTRGLIEGLGRVDRANVYEILIPNSTCRFPYWPNFHYRYIRFPFFKRRVWEQLAPLMVGNYDLLHFPYDSCIAVKRGKFIVTIHDVKPLLFPGSIRPDLWRNLLKRIMTPHPFQQIDHVVTVSESSRRDILERLPVRPEHVSVIYPGVELERFTPPPSSSSRTEGEGPYILTVAGNDRSKNVPVLLEAFANLPRHLRESHRLMLVGDLRPENDLGRQAQRLGLGKQVVFTGVISDDRLIEFYRKASVFVFPSLYEGFGFPALEAMACGCPVISSRTSSLPEVVGEAGILVDPLDVAGMSRAMERVLTDEAFRERLATLGPRRAGQFRWEKTARETIQLYEKVVRSAASPRSD